jgi:O-antigen/teichoic acid export membrane protein
MAPFFARTFHAGELDALQCLTTRSARAALVGALPIALVLLFWGKPVMNLIYGTDYGTSSYPALVLLTLGQFACVGFGPVISLLNMAGYERDCLVAMTFGLLLNLILGFLLIPPWGLLGGAAALILGLLSWNALLSFRVLQRMGVLANALAGLKGSRKKPVSHPTGLRRSP